MLLQSLRIDKSKTPLLILFGFILLTTAALYKVNGFFISDYDLSNKILYPGKYAGYFYTLISLGMIYGLGVMLHRLSKDHFLLIKNYYLTPWFFIWIAAAWYSCFQISVSPLLLILLSYTLFRLLELFNARKAQQFIFDASFCIGLAFFLYPPIIIFYIWILVAMLIYQSLTLKHFLLSLLALLTPIFLLASVQYLFNFQLFESYKLTELFQISFTGLELNYLQWPMLIFYLGLSIGSGVEVLMKISKKPIKERKSFALINIFMLLVFLSSFFKSSNIEVQLQISSLGACFLWANHFTHAKKLRLSNILLSIWWICLILFMLS